MYTLRVRRQCPVLQKLSADYYAIKLNRMSASATKKMSNFATQQSLNKKGGGWVGGGGTIISDIITILVLFYYHSKM